MIYFLRYWMPVMLLCAALFIQSAYPSPKALPSFAWSDKILHFAVYGCLAVLFCRGFNSFKCLKKRWKLLFFLAVAASTLYGLSDEWHQTFVAQRSADMADAVADFLGASICCSVYLFRLSRRGT
jgi:VanZ family protein